MALTADHLIVIGRGHIIADGPVDDDHRPGHQATVRVRSPHADQLAAALGGPDVVVTAKEPGVLEVIGSTTEQIGDAAAAARLILHELTPVAGSLEEAYMTLTPDEVEYHSDAPVPAPRLPQDATRTTTEEVAR